ncbi:hypothetical protein [Tumebacillus flagellatus]|uniref:Nucleotidyltransferase family protein n=1 Tax=Tumebacillus flagellatus TaxID=1157490 RepID=A0A074LXH0_9BACL|nr:hypothetical protein [Tumebacillus flagellatus]KEO84818.1 hypothetical protein EL26_02065 [Tumebacillus flagellatus]
MEMQHAIEKTARCLNAAGVTWAAGASWMLLQNGVVEQARDFDLLVKLDDAQRAKEVLLQLGSGRPGVTKQPYLTKQFWTFEVDGMEIDMMAGFTLAHAGGEYLFPFDEAHIVGHAAVGTQSVPLSAPEDWLVLYLLMGREPRVGALEAHFQKKGLANPHLLQKALEQPLPTEIRTRVESVFSACQGF